jgi:hypothetical protein
LDTFAAEIGRLETELHTPVVEEEEEGRLETELDTFAAEIGRLETELHTPVVEEEEEEEGRLETER